jgi:hypothetical protein
MDLVPQVKTTGRGPVEVMHTLYRVNAIQKCHRLRKPEMSPLRRNGSAASQGGDIRYRSPDWLRGLLALRVFVRNACLTAMAFQEGACRSLYSRYARSQV